MVNRNSSSLFLKVDSEQSSSRRFLGRQLNNFGPNTAKDFSLRVVMLGYVLLSGGRTHTGPRLPVSFTWIVFGCSMFGAYPFKIFQVYIIKYLSLLRSSEYKFRYLSLCQ